MFSALFEDAWYAILLFIIYVCDHCKSPKLGYCKPGASGFRKMKNMNFGITSNFKETKHKIFKFFVSLFLHNFSRMCNFSRFTYASSSIPKYFFWLWIVRLAFVIIFIFFQILVCCTFPSCHTKSKIGYTCKDWMHKKWILEKD